MRRLDLRSAAALIADEISKLNKGHIIVAIDGRCASGKTSLAAELERLLGCTVIHMDDFFLRKEQRTEERLNIPGENTDHERFLSEVLKPLSCGRGFSYRPYRCNTASYGDPIIVSPSNITVIEGSYSCHSELRGFYDLCVFTDVGSDIQLDRIKSRGGSGAEEKFRNIWIPLEEKYFERCRPQDICRLYIEIV